MPGSINNVVLVGNLTRDPDLRATATGTSVCALRVAVNERRRNGETWEDRPNYFDVTVFGSQAETSARYLKKGRPVGVAGRLEWREWESADGQHRQAVSIIADTVQFLGSPPQAGDSNGAVPAAVGAASDDDAEGELEF